MSGSGSFASESEARGWPAGQEPGPRVRTTDAVQKRLAAARSLGETLDTRGTRSMDSDLCAAAGLLRLLAEQVEALRTEVTKRQEYLDELRTEAGKNYGDAKKLRRWLDEERELSLAHSEETEAAEAKLARVRALHQPMQRAGTTNCAHCSGWNGTRCLGVVTPWPCPTLAALDGTGEA